jgi:hypothetical protein
MLCKPTRTKTTTDERTDGQNGTRNLQTLKTINFATRQESGAGPMVRWSSRWVGKFRSVRWSVPYLPPGGLSKMPPVAGSNRRGSHFQITLLCSHLGLFYQLRNIFFPFVERKISYPTCTLGLTFCCHLFHTPRS